MESGVIRGDGSERTRVDERNKASMETQLTSCHFITSDSDDRTSRTIRRQPLSTPGPHTHTVFTRGGSRLGPEGPRPSQFSSRPPVLVPMKARKKCDDSADNSDEDAFVVGRTQNYV